MMGYDEIKKELDDLPVTFYPALLIHLLEIVIDKKIFNGKTGLMNMIDRVIAMKGYK